MESKVFYGIIAFVGVLNLMVSIYIARRGDLEPFQKKAQIILIWLIPLIAAIGIGCTIAVKRIVHIANAMIQTAVGIVAFARVVFRR